MNKTVPVLQAFEIIILPYYLLPAITQHGFSLLLDTQGLHNIYTISGT